MKKPIVNADKLIGNILSIAKQKGKKIGELEEYLERGRGYFSKKRKGGKYPSLGTLLNTAAYLDVELEELLTYNLLKFTKNEMRLLSFIKKLQEDCRADNLNWNSTEGPQCFEADDAEIDLSAEGRELYFGSDEVDKYLNDDDDENSNEEEEPSDSEHRRMIMDLSCKYIPAAKNTEAFYDLEEQCLSLPEEAEAGCISVLSAEIGKAERVYIVSTPIGYDLFLIGGGDWLPIASSYDDENEKDIFIGEKLRDLYMAASESYSRMRRSNITPQVLGIIDKYLAKDTGKNDVTENDSMQNEDTDGKQDDE